MQIYRTKNASTLHVITEITISLIFYKYFVHTWTCLLIFFEGKLAKCQLLLFLNFLQEWSCTSFHGVSLPLDEDKENIGAVAEDAACFLSALSEEAVSTVGTC